jgi:hypothetical protein
MKQAPSTRNGKKAVELRTEYRFDYSKARPNRYAARIKQGVRVIALDPDVAKVFTDAVAVNAVLRAWMETMPGRP